MDTISNAITRIVDKLARLRREGRERHTEQLGVSSHRFQMSPPARSKEIAEFERLHGVSLPEDYRAFLTTVGNGGAGPYYGILPLARWNDALVADPVPRDLLARPCPLPAGFKPGKEWLEQLGCTPDEAWQGTIALAHQGCAYYALLVVSGALRGRIVYVSLDDLPPYVVTDASFLAWYERWLDETLADLEIFWFGMGPGGSDEHLMADLTLKSPRARAIAASELGRRKRPSPEITGALVHACRDPAVEVRAAALSALRYSGSVGVTVGIAALDDPYLEVRNAASWILRRLRDASAANALQDALALATDSDEFFGIGCALGDINGLRVADLAPHAASLDDRVRGSVAYFLGKTGDPAAVTPLSALLHDAVARVRLNAVQALEKVGAARARSALEAQREVETDALVRSNVERVIRESSRG